MEIIDKTATKFGGLLEIQAHSEEEHTPRLIPLSCKLLLREDRELSVKYPHYHSVKAVEDSGSSEARGSTCKRSQGGQAIGNDGSSAVQRVSGSGCGRAGALGSLLQYAVGAQ